MHRSVSLSFGLIAVAFLGLAPKGMVSESQAGAPTPAATTARKDFLMLMVDKARLTADLRTWPESGGVSLLLRSFRIAIGKQEGDKEKEGDNKTPEGIYLTRGILSGKSLPIKYGPVAIPIDFPNPIDRFAKKTGHGIWLHGVEKDTRVDEAKVTEGCVAFYNADITRLTDWVKPLNGVVVIAQDTKGVNDASDVEVVTRRSQEWAEAWGRRDLDAYMGFYSEAFEHESKKLPAWREYKQRVFSSYKVMNVKFTELRVATHPKYAMTMMNQDFRGDQRFTSVGRKMLYWQKAADGQWYITREVFGPQQVQPHTYSDAELALLSGSGSSISSKQEPSAPNL